MYDFRMLHVARLMLEGWVFTSVQNKKKHNTPTKQNNNKTPKPRHPSLPRTMFYLLVLCRGLATLRANRAPAAGPNKKPQQGIRVQPELMSNDSWVSGWHRDTTDPVE